VRVVRVVAGSARGRRLEAPPGAQTRPTTDRVREAVFNALWSRGLVEGADVLDLFAGSGALGIEALSRGAAHATFVDDDPRARRAVERNLAACGLVDRATVVADRAERFLARSPAGRSQAVRASGPPRSPGAADESDEQAESSWFDLAFCDPPYAFDGWEQLLRALPADVVVVEAGAEVALPTGWELTRSTRYGTTWVGFAERGPARPRTVKSETLGGGE
jgi:16S rRNA (guanine966-N2)-methyltransferase